MIRTLSMLSVVALLLVNTGCKTAGSSCCAADAANSFADVKSLVAVMQPTGENKTKGLVIFTPTEGGITVTAKITGLSPNAKHAIHIHQFGDATDSATGKSAGGHYNPEGHDHALPTSIERHAGDLGNLSSDANGNATYSITVNNVSLTGPANAIIGRSVIIHAKGDDGGQPTGNAGPRIAIGVIGVAKN